MVWYGNISVWSWETRFTSNGLLGFGGRSWGWNIHAGVMLFAFMPVLFSEETAFILIVGQLEFMLDGSAHTLHNNTISLPTSHSGAVSLLLGTDGMHDTSSRPAITVRSPYSLFSVAGQKKKTPAYSPNQ